MNSLFGEYNRRALLFLTGLERWQIAGLVAVGLALLVLTWVDLSGLSRRRRALLVGLRAMAMGIGMFFVLEPAIELRQVSVIPNQVLVLVDTSASQGLEGEDGRSRADRAADALDALAPLIGNEGDGHNFTVSTFDAVTTPSSLDAVRALLAAPGGPQGDASHLLEALDSAADDVTNGDIGGVVIVSDGVDNGELAARVPRGGALDDETLRRLERIDAPIHTIATAREDDIRDVAITGVRHDEFAFVRNAVAVTAEVRVHAVDADRIPVTLYRGGAAVQSRDVLLEPDRERYTVEFEFVPELTGKEIYTVATPVLPDEALAENNRHFFVIDVIRDKTRALLVVGRPTWDVRFLRQLLRTNPNVDLVSFFILRTQDDLHRDAGRELALIPFPTRELFDEQLGSFDVVVMQNFDYAPYEMGRYLPRIREYVNGGGGLVMIGGDLSFQSGGYGSTDVAEVLPVRLPTSTDPSVIVDEESFRPALTSAGMHHPITRLAHDPRSNRALWESLPELHGTNVVEGARDGAVVLATHPLRQTGGEPMPVVTVANVGQGRSMAVTADSTWRWAFEGVATGGASSPYSTFWNNAIRWLIRDPELDLVDVVLPGDIAEPDETVEGVVRVLGPDYQPAADESVELVITRRDLDALGDGAPTEEVERRTAESDARGEVAFTLETGRPGAYRVEASFTDDAGQPHADAEVFLRVDQREELRDIAARPALLEALSAATGGTHVAAGERVGNLSFRAPRVEEVDRHRVIDLWSAPWVLFALVGLLSTEWILRRRWGRL